MLYITTTFLFSLFKTPECYECYVIYIMLYKLL